MNSIGTMVPSPSFTPPESLMDCTAALSTASELTPNERNGPDFAPQPAILTVRSSAAAGAGCANAISATAAAAATLARAVVDNLDADMVDSSVCLKTSMDGCGDPETGTRGDNLAGAVNAATAVDMAGTRFRDRAPRCSRWLPGIGGANGSHPGPSNHLRAGAVPAVRRAAGTRFRDRVDSPRRLFVKRIKQSEDSPASAA